MTNQIQLFNFRGEALEVSKQGDDLFVSVRRVCEALGIDPRTQGRKLASTEWANVVEMTVWVGEDGRFGDDLRGHHDLAGQERALSMIHVDSLPMWLATISPDKVAEAARPKLVAFQKEAARVLADHFLGRRGEPRDLTIYEKEALRRQAVSTAHEQIALYHAVHPTHTTKAKRAETRAVVSGEAIDTIDIWLDICTAKIPQTEGRDLWCRAGVAYVNYCLWCADNDHIPVTNKHFVATMLRAGLATVKRGVVRYSISILPLSTDGRAA